MSELAFDITQEADCGYVAAARREHRDTGRHLGRAAAQLDAAESNVVSSSDFEDLVPKQVKASVRFRQVGSHMMLRTATPISAQFLAAGHAQQILKLVTEHKAVTPDDILRGI